MNGKNKTVNGKIKTVNGKKNREWKKKWEGKFSESQAFFPES